MNKILENIKKRRSVRNFNDEVISKKVMKEILEAGNYAPSGANLQPWRFIVVDSKETKNELRENAIPVYKNYMKTANEGLKAMREKIDAMVDDPIYYSADKIVFVIGKKIMSYKNDCSMVCQNMMLAARSHGIGSCWVYFGQMGLNESIKRKFDIKKDEEIFGPIVFGYPDGEFPSCPNKKEIDVSWL